MFTSVSAFQMGLIHIIAGLMGAAVFERYPRLRVSFGKSGAGWLAYALHCVDIPVRPDQRQAHRRHRRRHDVVGLGRLRRGEHARRGADAPLIGRSGLGYARPL